jgi:hypothetical protein
MKKRVIILVLLALLCLVGLLTFRPRVTAPSVATSFLGFTNSGSRQEALFALSNPPPASVSLHSVRRLSDTGDDATGLEAGHFSWTRREHWGLPYAITVHTTNEPLRVVFEFQQRSVGPRRIGEQIREVFGRITGNEREFFTGATFFVTNETKIENLPR